MNDMRLIGFYNTNCRSIKLGFFFAVSVVLCQIVAAQPAKNHIISKTINDWITVSQKQYERQLYSHAEDSLARAAQYEQYLSSEQKTAIGTLLEKIHNEKSEYDRIMEYIDRADEFIKQGQYLKAKAYLKQVKKSELLSDANTEKVKAALKKVDEEIDEQKKSMAALYKKSKKLYKEGDVLKAREGFAIVASSGLYVPSFGKTAEEYLAMIDPVYGRESETEKLQHSQPSSQDSLLLPSVTEEQYGNQPTQDSLATENVKQSYLKAVIRDAEARAKIHVGKAEFSMAKAVAQNAERIMQQYSSDLEQQVYDRYDERLRKLIQMINEEQRRWELRWDTKDSGL